MTGGTTAGYGRPRIRTDAISEAWGFEKQQLGVWIGTILILLLIAIIVMGPVFTFQFFAQLRAGRMANPGPPSFLSQIVSWPLGAALSAFFGGGLYRMATRQVRGEAISVGDVFGAGFAFGPLFLFYLALGAPSLLFGQLGGLGGLLGFAYTLVVYGVLLFVPPLIVDRRLDVMDSVRRNMEAISDQIGSAILLVLVMFLLVGITAAPTCGLAIFVTYPLMVLTVAVLYRDFFIAPEAAVGAGSGGVAGTVMPPPPGWGAPDDSVTGTPPPPRQSDDPPPS